MHEHALHGIPLFVLASKMFRRALAPLRACEINTIINSVGLSHISFCKQNVLICSVYIRERMSGGDRYESEYIR